MTTYTIEDNIPLPDCDNKGKGGARRGPVTPWTQALEQLQPGQSVMCAEFLERRAADQFRVRRPERKFAIRKVGGEGWRVWRTA